MRKASRELVNEAKQYHFVFAKRDFARFHPISKSLAKRFAGQALTLNQTAGPSWSASTRAAHASASGSRKRSMPPCR